MKTFLAIPLAALCLTASVSKADPITMSVAIGVASSTAFMAGAAALVVSDDPTGHGNALEICSKIPPEDAQYLFNNAELIKKLRKEIPNINVEFVNRVTDIVRRATKSDLQSAINPQKAVNIASQCLGQ